MLIHVFTLFPGMFRGPLEESIVGRARENKLLQVELVDFRDYTNDRHRTVDDYPYGGGPGMVLKPEPLFAAVQDVLARADQATGPDRVPTEPAGDPTAEPAASTQPPGRRIILFSPQGVPFNQDKARELAALDHLLLICGHYEGVDERIRLGLADEEVSIGDYVLTGGELPALVLIDAVARLLPGVLGSPEGAVTDSFSGGLLEYPQYTRPPVYAGWSVPDVLLSGNHEAIRRWRRREALRRTLARRPDLLNRAVLSEEDRAFVDQEPGSLNGVEE